MSQANENTSTSLHPLPAEQAIIPILVTMTKNVEWKIANWIWRHRGSKRKDAPNWFPADLVGRYAFFHVESVQRDRDGYSILSPEDIFLMTDEEIDAFLFERRKLRHEFRDWLEPMGVIVANIIALAALILSIIAFAAGQ